MLAARDEAEVREKRSRATCITVGRSWRRDLLRAEGHRQLQEFERTIPLRNVVVNGFAGTAALEGIPLSAQ